MFPKTDWIIGNHSDELSPWIPVIAARSSYDARFFVLPCCAYEFDGNKYQRQNAKASQYQDFMTYVERISSVCGFRTYLDRLKIPSTKRTCIIGNGRTYDASEFLSKSKEIQLFIDERTRTTCTDKSAAWSSDFKPRSNVETVKNCSTVDKTIQSDIILCIFENLLAKRRYISDFVNPTWNIGGQMALGDLIKFIPATHLQKLKSECGGLQTLLKNNHQIFLVQKGMVQIRQPIRYTDRLLEQKQKNNGDNKQFIFKQKPCWFHEHHPDGCPFSIDDCSFKHVAIKSE